MYRLKEPFEKWYVIFMLMKIARHNHFRMKFEKKYEEYFSEEELEYMTLEKCYVKDKKLYKKSKELNEYEAYVAGDGPQPNDFGLYEYVNQERRHIEDDYYGTIYTKTPFKDLWLKIGFRSY